MNILLDVDSVVCEIMPEWLRRYNIDYDDHLEKKDITDWEISQIVKPECGTKIFDYLKDPFVYYNSKPVDGALNGVQALRDAGHNIVFVTSGFYLAKVHWLAVFGFLKNARWRNAQDVVIAASKNLIRGDVLIDDYPGNLRTFPGNKVLFSQPWNEGARSLTRMKDWSDVMWILAGLNPVLGV